MKAMNHLHTINSNDHALKCLKMLMCLPLLPADKMEQGFQLIKLFATNHNVQMNDFFNYYQRYWLRSVGTNIVSVNGLPRRTNNNLESFHNSLRCTFSVTHPNLWVFLGELCKLNQNYHRAHSQLTNGLQPTRNLKSKYLINSRRIKIASEQLDAGVISVWNFLVKCTYSCSSYEQRQRLWALGMGDQNQPDGDNIVNDVNAIEENAEEVVEEETAQHAVNGTPCMICLVTMPGENTSQFIVIPCGHAWICGICKDRLNNEYLVRCPMCRADVERFQRIFINY
uniref:RING-type domain-containing protein n=1 Tax=Schizaphis graminum TaxID=13262 RepID=A0A2S2P6K7_SCHGA